MVWFWEFVIPSCRARASWHFAKMPQRPSGLLALQTVDRNRLRPPSDFACLVVSPSVRRVLGKSGEEGDDDLHQLPVGRAEQLVEQLPTPFLEDG